MLQIKVLGSGCPNCKKVEAIARKAVETLGIQAEIVKVTDYNQIMELQKILTRMGYDVGKIDGKLGAQSRAAVKSVQIKLGLPADSWPTSELLNHLRNS